MAKVKDVCISEKKGEQKHPVDEVMLKVDHGIVGDAHAGNWHRQVSLLAAESVEKVQKALNFKLKSGDFAENILTEGIELFTLPIGTKLRIGEAVGEVTQIGKPDHPSVVTRTFGVSILPYEGRFCRVIKGGVVKKGDEVKKLQ